MNNPVNDNSATDTSVAENSVIHRLQQKFPHHRLTVLDIRSATIRKLALGSPIASAGKDLAFSETVVRARKPRSRDTVDLCEFDEELEMFLYVAQNTVYYMPTGYNRYCHYKTNVLATGSIFEDITQMVKVGLDQSAQIHGEMKIGETRMFCLQNDQVGSHTCAHNPYALIHVTVYREGREFRVAAEVAAAKSKGYYAMLSIGLPAEALK